MGEKIVIGPITRGLRNDVLPFNVDNDAFPVLNNMYQWRGRLRRKRGTEFLGRLTRYFDSTSTAFNPGTTTQALDGSGNGNLLTGFASSGIESTATIEPGSVTITAPGPTTYTDPSEDGTLSPSGSINYATGAITIAAEAGNTISATFNYFPALPVMGLEPLLLDPTDEPDLLAFDTTYAYNVNPLSPYAIHAVNFYWNPPSSGSYTQKTTWTPLEWVGETYRQFWSVNYQNSLWVSNGINVPFDTTKIGMQYKAIVTVTVTSATTATLQINTHGLTVGDYVFVNEVATTTGINYQTGYVTTVSDPNNVVVTFPNATLAANGTGGIAQYLTRSADATRDCIRYYTGLPVDQSALFQTTGGFVNFCPPLSNADFSIADSAADQYYLVGARMIVPFKDRLLFIGPVIQTSTAGSQRYLQDTIIYSQNGTPYYTASFAGSPSSTTSYTPLLTPNSQTASPQTFWGDQTGLGGWFSAGFASSINTVSENEDVLILGFGSRQARLVYTSNDLLPFEIYVINSELGADATFSSINLDRGAVTLGARGFVITSQVDAKRLDLAIPDEVFRINRNNNGSLRVAAARDYRNEWIYFTYNSPNSTNVFPNKTLLYNYRDDAWATLDESFTTYGLFKKQSGYTWAAIGSVYPTWSSWNTTWQSGSSTLLQPEVVGGNQQGFVLVKAKGTDEGNSNYIKAITTAAVVTSVDHGLETGDFIYIENCLGTFTPAINDQIYEVQVIDEDSFSLVGKVFTTATYLGNGVFKRYVVPFFQTRQFPVSWAYQRKTRLGVQQYLFTKTVNGQVSIYIYLSENSDQPYNDGPIVPANNSINNALIYNYTLETGPQLGINYSPNLALGSIGDGVLTSYTIDVGMLFGFQGPLVAGSLSVTVGSVATFTDNGDGTWTTTGTGSGGSISYQLNQITLSFSGAPTNQVSTITLQYYYPDIQNPTALQQSQIWQRVNTSLVGDTVQIGLSLNRDQMLTLPVGPQVAEIELHSMVLDVFPSSYLA